MLTIHWQQDRHHLRRLVVQLGHEPYFDTQLAKLANDHDLALSDADTLPRAGDFWIGTHPRAGWGDADASRIAWASVLEVPLALRVLQAAARQQNRPVILHAA